MNPQELAKADFVTFPIGISGTKCTNCKYFDRGRGDDEYDYPHCEYKGVLKLGSFEIPLDLVGLKVGADTCCVAWDADGVRHGGEKKVGIRRKS